MFASKTFAEHLIRGLIGIAAFALAIRVGSTESAAAIAASLGFAGVGLLALRGCPICWTTGLFEMIGARRKG